MKKTIFVLTAIIGLTLQSFGQGQLVFANGSTSKVFTNSTASSTSGIGVNISGAGNYIFALFYNAVTNSSSTAGVSASATPWNSGGWSMADGSGYATNTGSAGRISGVVNPLYTSISALAPGIFPNLEIIGWNTEGGTINTLSDFETAYAAALAQNVGVFSGLYYGYSSVGSIQLGNGTAPLNSNLMGISTGQIGAFTLGQVLGVTPTPEPGTMALAALGGASLLLFRRRK
jgi:hypothetical protein